MFKPGQSGNPKGRQKGSKDKRTEYRDMLASHVPALILRAVALAMEGDTAALRLCLDKVIPNVKPRGEAVKLALPKNGTLTEQAQKIMASMASGKLTPYEASTLLAALASQARIIEVDELTQRIEALEAKHGSNT